MGGLFYLFFLISALYENHFSSSKNCKKNWLGLLVHLVPTPLQSLPTLKQINTLTQLGVICKLTGGALDPLVQIINKDIKQNWPQC